MSAVYVIHKDERSGLRRNRSALPAACRWASTNGCRPRSSRSATIPRCSRRLSGQGPAILAVVSRSAVTSARFRRQVDQALASGTPCIPIYVGLTAEEVGVAGTGDAPGHRDRLGRRLASRRRHCGGRWPRNCRSERRRQKPARVVDGRPSHRVAREGVLVTCSPLRWHDRTSAAERCWSARLLVTCSRGRHPYDSGATKTDLDALRRKRQFLLMRDYASAAVRLSPDNFRARRQLGQALIELGELD